MKKKINRRLAIVFLMIFVIYMMLGQMTQLLQLQKDVVQESQVVIGQLAKIAQREQMNASSDEAAWNELLSLGVDSENSEILVADAQTEQVIGATEETFSGKELSEIGILPMEYRKFGRGFYVTLGRDTYYGVFFENDGLLYGRLKEQSAIYRPMGAPTIVMPIAVVVFMIALGIGISRYTNENITRPLKRLSDAIRRFTDGESNVSFSTGKTDFDEIRQIGSCMNQIQQMRKNTQAELDEHKELLTIESERADMSSAAKRVFLARMSHDIRTPMNGIIGMTAIAEANIDDPDHVRDALAKIESSGKQLLAMLNDVLDMSMIECGRLDLKEEDFQLAELINRTIAQLRAAAEERQHHLIVDVKRLVHEHVVGAPDRVQTIFSNIIENSIKFTPRGGTIRVTIRELPSEIKYAGKYSFVFEDDGIGMTPEMVKHIFEPFERESKDQRTGPIGGMGLGLPLVKNIVELMNGSIKVESEPDVGSKFTVIICLKLQRRAEGVATRMMKNEVRIEDFRQEDYSDKRVLVVEDHDLSGETASEMLALTGMEVERLQNGQQAVLRMTEVPENYFDLVLMDIQMPVMDGYIATRMIRNMKREDVKQLPIIAMTALSSSEDMEAARQAGMDGYITKPLELDRLKEVLLKWL